MGCTNFPTTSHYIIKCPRSPYLSFPQVDHREVATLQRNVGSPPGGTCDMWHSFQKIGRFGSIIWGSSFPLLFRPRGVFEIFCRQILWFRSVLSLQNCELWEMNPGKPSKTAKTHEPCAHFQVFLSIVWWYETIGFCDIHPSLSKWWNSCNSEDLDWGKEGRGDEMPSETGSHLDT